MKFVSIKTPEPSEGGPSQTQGTRFYADNGAEIHGVTSAMVFYDVDRPVRARLELYLGDHAEINATPSFCVRHPFTGDVVPVEAIELTTGERIELGGYIDTTTLRHKSRERRRRK